MDSILIQCTAGNIIKHCKLCKCMALTHRIHPSHTPTYLLSCCFVFPESSELTVVVSGRRSGSTWQSWSGGAPSLFCRYIFVWQAIDPDVELSACVDRWNDFPKILNISRVNEYIKSQLSQEISRNMKLHMKLHETPWVCLESTFYSHLGHWWGENLHISKVHRPGFTSTTGFGSQPRSRSTSCTSQT